MNTQLSSRNKVVLAVLAVVLLILPAAARYLWFYQGSYRPQEEIAIPKYSELELPQPELSTPAAATKAARSSTTQLLLDISHYNQFSISELETLTNLVALKGGHLNVTDLYGDLDAELKKADAYVVIAPTLAFSNYEVQSIRRFVERGGRLLVISDPTRGSYGEYVSLDYATSTLSDIEIANLLLEPFGIAFSNDYVYNLVKNEGNFRNVIFKDIDNSALTKSLKEVVLYGSHSFKAVPKALISGDDNTFSSLTDQGSSLVVAGSNAEGNVLVLGDLNFMTPPYNRVADNAILIENIASFLTGNARQRTLADFPYLFTRPVILLVDGEKSLGTEMLTTITGAQQSLDQMGLDLSIASQPAADHDLIAFGTFPPAEELEPYLAPFNLVFSETAEEEVTGENLEATPEPALEETPATEELDLEALLAEMNDASTDESGPTIEVPGFGKILTANIGLILYDDTGKRNTVILLADTQENLKILSSAFYSGSLESCAIQGQIAVCLLGEEDEGFYWEDSYEDYSQEYYYDTPEPTTDLEPVG
jgi:hypothetical protein